MKQLSTTLILLCLTINMVLAQSPQTFSYQAVVRDVSGNIKSNQVVSFQISILEDSTNGPIAYSETHIATTNHLGLVNLQIGNGIPVSNTFSFIDWANHDHFIKVEIDFNGGTLYSLMSTSQLLSVPYALYGEDADADPENENQQLFISGDTIFISNGNFIVLPGKLTTNCNDGILNGDETGVDCGGATCVSCATLCSDSIQNGDETGVDCGGTSCVSCAIACFDGIQNGNETGVDCGGTFCVSCATLCSDGIQNGDETGVDCGGTSCVSCATLCSDGIQNGDETGVDCGGTSCVTCIQLRLDTGETPKQIFDSGIPLDSLYGKIYQEGLIFALDTITGAGGLAAPTDQSSGAPWGCSSNSSPGATSASIGTGYQNTQVIIMRSCTPPGAAAHLCANLTIGTYSDWFLPSKDELNLMYVNLKTRGLGGFANNFYWSSTEFGAFNSRGLNFGNGIHDLISKNGLFRVRAARAF